MKKRIIPILILSLVISIVSATTSAFSIQSEINATVSYALTWSSNDYPLRNPAYPNFDNDGGDCANFVSQCLNQVLSTNNNWKPGITILGVHIGNTASWSNANALYSYLVNNLYTQTGYAYYCSTSTTTTSYRPAVWGSKSNPYFYDLDGNGTYDHTSIGTYHSTNAYGQITGVYVSAHNSERENVAWDLYAYLSDAQKITTKYASVMILRA